MAASYNLFRNPSGADKEKKNDRLHARLVNQQTISTERIAEEISNYCSFSSADVKGMLEIFRFVMDLHLQYGEIIDLEGIGTFNVSLKSIPSSDEREITPSKVRFNKVVFRCSKGLKDSLRKNMKLERSGEGSRLKGLSAGKRKESIIRYLEEYGTISSAICRGINQCSKYLAMKDLSELQQENKIIRIGVSNNAQYMLKENE